jgi:hypothetical protein
LQTCAQPVSPPFDHRLSGIGSVREHAGTKDVLQPDELRDLHRARMHDDVERHAALEGAAVIEDRHPVGEEQRFIQVVCDEHDRDGELAAQLGELGVETLARGAIDRRERLVEQEHVGLAREGAGDGDALLLPTREVRGQPVLESVEMHAREQIERPALACVARHVDHRLHHVRGRGEVREQAVMLEHEPDPPLARGEIDARARIEPGYPVGTDVALLRPGQPGDRTQDRRLAAARRADEREQLLRRAVELDVERYRRRLPQPHLQTVLSHAAADRSGALSCTLPRSRPDTRRAASRT